MSVRIAGPIIHIEGNSRVEDAEPVLAALQEMPGRTVDLSQAIRLHSASIQLLLALRPVITGTPRDPFQARYLAQLIDLGGDDSGKSVREPIR